MKRMSDDPQASPVPPEVSSSSETAPETRITTTTDEPSGSPLAVFDAATPLPVRPEVLAQGLRYLRERIPGYVQLSVDEERSRLRAAFLEPEFIEGGIALGVNWGTTKDVLGASGEELRHENDEIARWDETIREHRVLLKGMEDANLERRYRLGNKILLLYKILKTTIDNPDRRHLRPYLEEMKRAYLRKRKKPAKPEPKGEPEEPKE